MINALLFTAALVPFQPSIPVRVSQPTTAIKTVLVAHAAAQVADLVSTRQALGRGASEANALMRPFAGSTWKLATVKVIATAGISAALWWIHTKHPKVALIVGGILTAGTGYIAYRNTQVGR